MGSTFGHYLRVTTFGESHGPGVGVVVDGLPSGLALDPAVIQRDLDRRKPGTSSFVSPRRESDRVQILSGVSQGSTLGSPVALLVMNEDARSGDYDSLQTLFRPGHADFTYFMKYGLPPQPGGGRASGRETVGRVAGGAIARLLLERHGMSVQSHTLSVGEVIAQRVEPGFADRNPLRCPDPDVAHLMEEAVDAARADRDSLGGVVEVVIDGPPPGLGEPVADKLDALLGSAFFSIGAVKGVEFGDGFALARMRGSQSNDPMASTGFLTNKAGGILGGISTGQPIVVRLAVKPTPSIGKPQQTTDLGGTNATIEIAGRHDPCICPRIGPVAEAMAALVIADCLTANRARKHAGK